MKKLLVSLKSFHSPIICYSVETTGNCSATLKRLFDVQNAPVSVLLIFISMFRLMISQTLLQLVLTQNDEVEIAMQWKRFQTFLNVIKSAYLTLNEVERKFVFNKIKQCKLTHLKQESKSIYCHGFFLELHRNGKGNFLIN